MNFNPLLSNLLRLQCFTVSTLLEVSIEVLLCERVNDPRRSLFYLLKETTKQLPRDKFMLFKRQKYPVRKCLHETKKDLEKKKKNK